mmetsp:Transcript_72911/g.121705  ORF Transcript_72911/g.121705 Transcript_72911/m.121705 type:complete len:218 (-) Transcript_72911:348-1001(-)
MHVCTQEPCHNQLHRFTRHALFRYGTFRHQWATHESVSDDTINSSLLIDSAKLTSILRIRTSVLGAMSTAPRISGATEAPICANFLELDTPRAGRGLIRPATHRARALGFSAAGMLPSPDSNASSCPATRSRPERRTRLSHFATIGSRAADLTSSALLGGSASTPSSSNERARARRSSPIVVESTSRSSQSSLATITISAVPAGWMPGITGRMIGGP